MSTPEIRAQARLNELIRIEAKYQIAQIMKTHPAAKTTGIDGTMSRWLSGILLRAQTPHEALQAWRNLKSRGGRSFPDDFAPKQREFLELPDDQILSFFAQALTYRATPYEEQKDAIKQRMVDKAGHGFNNKHQFRTEEKRSLRQLRENGMCIQITPEYVELIRHHYTESPLCPILDTLKNKPILTINGFANSKASLTIHDMFDHFWTYDLFETHGILNRYDHLLQKVGNPQGTDIFKREGEMIASISYEWRSSHTPERHFTPILTFEQIVRLFTKNKKNGLSHNQERALSILRNLDPHSEEARKIASMYSGVLVELMEQRRKQGYIQILDENNLPTKVLPLLDLEYAALVVEGAHLLCLPETQTGYELYKINVFVEDFLVKATQPNAPLEINLTLDAIRGFDPEKSSVSQERREWLKENFYHTATRITACD